MRLSIAALFHQTSALEQVFYPCVAECHTMLRGRFLVKVTDVQIEVFVAVKPQNSFRLSWRHALPARLALPAIEQSFESLVLIIPFPPPHRSVANSENLGRLPPGDLLPHGSQNHFLHLH